MNEMLLLDAADVSPVFVDSVAEKSNAGGMVRLGLACMLNERGNSIIVERLVMRLATAVELRNVLNALIDDERTGMMD